ncbi:hypothetical protein ACFL54_08020 [Planctomycetota bacterium]
MKMQDWVRKNLHLPAKTLLRLNSEFEIGVSLEALRHNPKDIEAMTKLGLAYTTTGAYDKALAIDLQLVGLNPDDPIAYYNLACSYALLAEDRPALDALQMAIDKGYNDLDWIQKDLDLDPIRHLPEFRNILEELYNRNPQNFSTDE